MDTAKGAFPLSVAQLDIWMSQKLSPDSAKFNIAEFLEIHGPVDPHLMEVALRSVAEESDAVRMRISEGGQGVAQSIGDLPDRLITYVDCASESDPWGRARQWMLEDLARPLNCARDRLFEYALFRLNDRHFIWYQRYHHLLVDGYSFSLIATRFAETYSFLAENGFLPNRAPRRVRDLVEYESSYRASDMFSADVEFWREYLDRTTWPPDLVRASVETGAVARLSEQINVADHETLRRIAAGCEAGLAHVLIAGVAAHLCRLTGNVDVAMRLVVANRRGPLRDVPGMVSNALPLRLRLQPQMSFADIVRHVGMELRTVLRRSRLREEDIRRELRFPTENFGPLVNVITFDYDLRFSGSPVTAHNLTVGPVADLSYSFFRRSDAQPVDLHFDGNVDFHDSSELQARSGHLLGLLHAIAKDPEKPLADVAVLEPSELRRLVATWNATTTPIPADTLSTLFERQAARNGQATAVVCGEQSLSYAELEARANQLAHLLAEQGVGPEDIVALALPRTSQMTLAQLATLKAGAAFL
ncbi:MAG TPA: condensation domain-containing protein, partial [Luteimonas sp.]|nr:condensation domain-containing protein [Luteimonas sp.]